MTIPDHTAQQALGQLDQVLAELLVLRCRLQLQIGAPPRHRPGWPIRRAAAPDQPASAASASSWSRQISML